VSEPAAVGSLTGDRLLAARVLIRLSRESGRIESWLSSDQPQLDAAARRRAWALVYGVLRNKSLLELSLGPYLKKSFTHQSREIQAVLLLGAYELSSMDAVPDRAAVHQSVELCRTLGEEPATGFVNAVLRRLARQELPPELPSRELEPRLWAEQVASHPSWLVDEMIARVGEQEATRWCETNNIQPPIFVRLRDENGDAAAQLELEPEITVPGAQKLLSREGAITTLPGFEEGAFWVQDAAAQAVGLMLGLSPGMRVLDACAAPGGKTLAAAQAVGPDGRVLAVDRSKSRLALLSQSVERLQLAHVEVQARNLLREPWGSRDEDDVFDAVLLDAPCSALGVIRRHPDVRWSREPKALEQYHRTQGDLLRAVAPAVAANAALVYSVCSFAELETDSVIAEFLDADDAFALSDPRAVLPESMEPLLDGSVLRTYPHRHDMDAFFAARLERTQ